MQNPCRETCGWAFWAWFHPPTSNRRRNWLKLSTCSNLFLDQIQGRTAMLTLIWQTLPSIFSLIYCNNFQVVFHSQWRETALGNSIWIARTLNSLSIWSYDVWPSNCALFGQKWVVLPRRPYQPCYKVKDLMRAQHSDKLPRNIFPTENPSLYRLFEPLTHPLFWLY